MGFYMFLPQKDRERSGLYRRFDGWGEVDLQNIGWVVVFRLPRKMMDLKSIGMMKCPI